LINKPVYLVLAGAGGSGQIESRLHSSHVAPKTGDKLSQRRAARILEHLVQDSILIWQRPVQPLCRCDRIGKVRNLRQQLETKV
jgi:hypothetical protein